jgi:hypothetical protein
MSDRLIKINAGPVPRAMQEAAKQSRAGRSSLMVIFERTRLLLAEVDHHLAGGHIEAARKVVAAGDAELDLIIRGLGGDAEGQQKLAEYLAAAD